mgnify:FL=1
MKHSYREEYTPVGDIQTYLLTYPAAQGKPVLLFLHGGPGVSECYAAYAYHELLGDACTLIFYDQRGAGRTLRRNPHAPVSLGLILDDLDALIHLLQSRYPDSPFILMGHSWGTVPGALYALQHPESIARYIGMGQVVSMAESARVACAALRKVLNVCASPHDRARFNALLPYPPAHWDRPSLEHAMLVQALCHKYGLREPNPVPMAPVMRHSPTFTLRDYLDGERGAQHNMPFLCAMANTFDLAAFPAAWRVPVTFITGGCDYITPLLPVQHYFEQMAAAEKQLIVMEDCGHCPMFDQPEKFREILLGQRQKTENEGV